MVASVTVGRTMFPLIFAASASLSHGFFAAAEGLVMEIVSCFLPMSVMRRRQFALNSVALIRI
jgi:hypothetical protein